MALSLQTMNMKKLFYYSLSFFLLLFTILFLSLKYHVINKQILKDVATTIPQVKPIITPFMQRTLSDVVEHSLAGTKGKYAVVVKNMKTGEEYIFNEHEKYDAASLYKLWVMASAYKQMSEGKLKKDEVLSDSIANINKSFNIASDEAELTDGDLTTTVDNAINQMITISHNYSALILSRRIGSSYISNYIDELGLKESSFDAPPQTTASDIALFYEKLYRKELVNAASSMQMTETLKKQQLNDRIPKKLPSHIAVAHKTGELGWAKHDAGIVFTPQGDYVIVVLSESDFPAGAAERIADLSKDIYDYFESI